MYNAKFFKDIISNCLKKVLFKVVAPEPDLSGIRFACVVASLIISILLGVWVIIQSHDMDKYTDTDLKYRFIQMNGSISSVGLDSIEVLFQDPDRVRNIRKMVTEHEQRMEQLRRSTLERGPLNNEINELNSQNTPNKKRKK